MKRISIYMTEKLHKEAKEYSFRKGITTSKLIRISLRKYLAEKEGHINSI